MLGVKRMRSLLSDLVCPSKADTNLQVKVPSW